MKLSRLGLVIHGDPYYSPKIGISPFDLKSQRIFDGPNQAGRKVFQTVFGGVEWNFTESGKSAIEMALLSMNLTREDEVWIQTSSGNLYVSRCVTEKIGQFCEWSMEFSDNTRLLYFIHDFGIDGSARLAELRLEGLPVIEDAAYGLLTAVESNWDLERSDYILFSFPKVFEMQFGGLLCGSVKSNFNDSELLDIVEKNACHWILQKDEIFSRRRLNFDLIKEEFVNQGFHNSYELNQCENPGVFMFEVGQKLPLDSLKLFFNLHGCESSVFYGRNSFFLPTHQNLDIQTINYMGDLLKFFIEDMHD